MNERGFTHTSFQAFLNENRFMAARCKQTGELFVPPRPMCPKTFSTDMEWVELSGDGQLAAFTAVHIGAPSMVAAGYDRKNPYLSGVVQLAEGPKISAQILGLDGNQPESIKIGTPLKVTFIERDNEEGKRMFLGFTVNNPTPTP